MIGTPYTAPSISIRVCGLYGTRPPSRSYAVYHMLRVHFGMRREMYRGTDSQCPRKSYFYLDILPFGEPCLTLIANILDYHAPQSLSCRIPNVIVVRVMYQHSSELLRQQIQETRPNKGIERRKPPHGAPRLLFDLLPSLYST